MTIKERIKALCKQKGVSMNKLEQDLNFGKGYISKLDKSTPNAKNMQAIADYFGVSVDYIIKGKKPELNLETSDNAFLFATQDKRTQEYMLKLAKLTESDKEALYALIDKLSN